LAARPGIVFVGLLGDAADVLVEVLRVVDSLLEVGLGVVLGPFVDDGVGALVTSPMTQYDRLVSMLGQVMPGFSFFNSSRDNPQLLAKSSHVTPKSALVSKEQSTPRARMEEAVATTAAGIPVARRSVSCIFFATLPKYNEMRN
jgi:hypothetical protein